jgi:thiamine pyrophosphate-dependent acetolactate synthase large subunit-like protein
VFTLIGGHISPILVAAEAAGIRVVDTRHEVPVTTVCVFGCISVH